MTGSVVLAYQVCSDLVLLMPGPGLSQPQVVDLTICPCCLEPPFTKAPFDPSHLHLLLEEVDLGGQCLALVLL